MMSAHEKMLAHAAGATVVDGVTFETPITMTQTQQDVVDALAAIDEASTAERRAVDERAKAKRQELQAQCGGIGHVFAYPLFTASISPQRMCVFCRAHEPAKEAQP